MKTIALTLVLLVTGNVIGQTFENPIYRDKLFEDHDFNTWYLSTAGDNEYMDPGDSTKYILFKSKEDWKKFEKEFMLKHKIKPGHKDPSLCSPNMTYYQLPNGHSMMSDAKFTMKDQKMVPGIMYRNY